MTFESHPRHLLLFSTAPKIAGLSLLNPDILDLKKKIKNEANRSGMCARRMWRHHLTSRWTNGGKRPKGVLTSLFQRGFIGHWWWIWSIPPTSGPDYREPNNRCICVCSVRLYAHMLLCSGEVVLCEAIIYEIGYTFWCRPTAHSPYSEWVGPLNRDTRTHCACGFINLDHSKMALEEVLLRNLSA